MSDFGQPPGGGGFGQPPGGGGFGQPPGGGGFGQPPGGGGFGPPPGGGYGAPEGGGFGAPPVGPMGGGGQKTETLALVSVIAGAVGLSSCCCACIFPVPLVAIVTGLLGMKKINQDPAGLKGKELCYVGMGLGALTLLLTIASVIVNLLTSGSATYDYGNMNF